MDLHVDWSFWAFFWSILTLRPLSLMALTKPSLAASSAECSVSCRTPMVWSEPAAAEPEPELPPHPASGASASRPAETRRLLRLMVMSSYHYPQYKNGWKHCTGTKCKWNYSSADVHFYNSSAGFLIQNRMGGTGSRMDGGGSYAAEAASSSSRAAKSFLPSRRRVVTFLMRPISTVRNVSSAPRAS